MTSAQLQVLKTIIANDPVLQSKPMNSDGDFDIAAALNQPAAPAFYVWQTAAPVDAVFNAVNWANMTPSPTPDATVAWSNWSLACQGKQLNLQTMLMGQATVNASRPNIRAGIQDALTGLPSGPNGASRSGGWAAVQVALTRQATRAEAALANVAGGSGSSTTTPATLVFEGFVSQADVADARTA